MKYAFLLQHSYEIGDCEMTKTLGIYSSRAKAEEEVERYRTLKGFCNHSDDFYIDRYEINENNWTEGFFTVYY